jgi:aminocarboxymuconate-semialdehyde decarboxylase
MGVPDPLARLDAAGLDADDRAAIAGGTAQQLGLVPGKES